MEYYVLILDGGPTLETLRDFLKWFISLLGF